MRIFVRTSKLAIWARRLALFSAILLAVAGLLHLFGQIAFEVFVISLQIVTVFAGAGLLLGIAAAIRLWFTGDRGWGQAGAGVVLGLLGLAPLGSVLVMASIYPATLDVTTALQNPPDMQLARESRADFDPETVLASYPNLITRIYQVPPDILYALGEELAAANGWDVLSATAPSPADPAGQLNALRPALLGWRSEIAFRVTPGAIGGAVIDLRAAAIDSIGHDLGENGRAIEAFLLALDDRVSGYIESQLAMGDDDETFEVIDAGDGP